MQIYGETVADFIFLGSKISADGDCSHEIKRCLLLGRKVKTNLDSIFKNRDITLPTKVHLGKAMVFPVVTYGYESWTVKKVSTEELMLLNCGVGEDSWESHGLQGDPTSILKEISPGCSLEGMMLKLKLQYFGHLMEELTHWRRLWCWEGLGAGGERDDRGWDGWMASPTRWTWIWVNSRSCDGQGGLACCNSWGCKESDMTEQLNWTELKHSFKWW